MIVATKDIKVWYVKGEEVEEMTLLSYDEDKYAEVKDHWGDVWNCKCGYLFNSKEDAVQVMEAWNSPDEDVKRPKCIDPYKLILDKKAYTKHRKAFYKAKSRGTLHKALDHRYEVYIDMDCIIKVKTLKRALNIFNSNEYSQFTITLYSYTHGPLCVKFFDPQTNKVQFGSYHERGNHAGHHRIKNHRIK